MSNLSPINDKSYTIADPTLTWTLDITTLTVQVPACGYPQTQGVSNNPTFVSVTTTQPTIFSVWSRNLADAGNHYIQVTSTLTGYNFSPAKIAPVCTNTFTLVTIDPCLATILNNCPSAIENFVAFAGSSIKSHLSYVFGDSVSGLLTLSTDSSDFCGPKTLIFSIDGLETHTFTTTSDNFIQFSPPASTTDFGVR